MPKFKRVNLDDVLRADADGMPVFRRCFLHEILLSFYDDAGAESFREWWDAQGAELLSAWMLKSEDPYIRRLGDNFGEP
jgi:hypothetical protein